MRSKANVLVVALMLVCSYNYGQLEKFRYNRRITGIRDEWHKVELPNEVFGKVLPDMADIRIFGITVNKDTVEVPYLLNVRSDQSSTQEVAFNLLNESSRGNQYYYTFENSTSSPVNSITLDFKELNFDRRIRIEGSNDQLSWFTIVENYRILSIKNKLTDYKFNIVAFPNSSYRFLRLSFTAHDIPKLHKTQLSENRSSGGILKSYPVSVGQIENDRDKKQSIILLRLPMPVPVSYLKICVHDTVDYYRPITINYLSDSFTRGNRVEYLYENLTTGTLNSIQPNSFTFPGTILQFLKITIDNQDNKSLKIDSFVVKGYAHELIMRFIEPGDYFLAYGNLNAWKPYYDIERFRDKIPGSLASVTLEPEAYKGIQRTNKKSALFENKAWLWGIMIVIIGILGWFSLRMIRDVKK